jgi:predicted Rdx family selenoprotein
LAAKIQRSIPNVEVELVSGGKGDFIVTSDGVELWNKRAMDDEFPEEEALVARLTRSV